MNACRFGLLLLLAHARPLRAALGAMPPLLAAVSVEVAEMANDDDTDVAPCEHDDSLHANDAGRTACHACDACCSASAPPAALPGVLAPPAVGVLVFATPTKPAASFLGDAPRRPPRRC